MAEKQASAFVFVSYSRADSELVTRLSSDLHSQGVNIWIDREGLQPGTPDWEEAIRNAVNAAYAVLLIASPNARRSRYVKDELRIAEMYRRSVFPVWAAGTEWMDSIPLGWGGTQFIDARGACYATAVREIVTVLSKLPGEALRVRSTTPVPDFEPRNPYKGLQPFSGEDACDFFGRDTFIHELAQALQESLSAEKKNGQSRRLLTVIGPSGSGKSSVVMAGLLPRLQGGKLLELPGSKEWVYLDPMVPGKQPIDALMRILKPRFPDTSFKTLREDLENDTADALHLLATQLVTKKGSRVVLLVDQLEELFTQTESENERQQFLELLFTAVTSSDGPVLVLLTLRADFYHRLMEYPTFYRLLGPTLKPLLAMEVEDLRATIEGPAALPDVQLSFEGSLVGDLLFEVHGQVGALPLLQFALYQLFERRDGHLLTLQAYREIGGVKGALSQHTEKTYQELLSDEQRRLARVLFLRLLEPGASEQDTTRRRAALPEFTYEDQAQDRLMHETIAAFIAARLLTTNEVAGTTTIEVSHEAVIREWKRLIEWLHEARDDIGFQHDFSQDVVEWERRKRPRDRLYRGTQLKEARGWAKRNMPSGQEAAFLRASVAQRSLSLAGLILVVLLLVSSLGIAGWKVFFQPQPTLVTTLQDSNTTDGSLRWCIDNAPSGSTIRFAQGLSGTIVLTGGDLVFAGGKTLTIIGPGEKQVTITAGNTGAIIHISKGATLTISGLSFKNSETVNDAFLFNEGTLNVTKSIISGNKTTASLTSTSLTSLGGGIENAGILIVKNSTISNNSSIGGSFGDGGGIYNKSTGIVTVTNSTLSNNVATNTDPGGSSYGGGISNEGGQLSVIDSTISGNKAIGMLDGIGGGIYNENGKVTVDTSTLSHNSASGRGSIAAGGGIANASTNASSTLIVTASTFSSNVASGKQYGYGGGIVNESKLIVTQSTFSHNSSISSNSSKSAGGGIATLGPFTAINSTFSDNIAEGEPGSYGGGIFYYGVKGFSDIIRFCTFYKNASHVGGGIFLDAKGSNQITLSSNVIAANSASTGPDIAGAVISDGYNLIENAAGVRGLNASTDRQVALADLKIAATPGSNGGPTQTLALLQGSPAIDVVPRQLCSITVTDASGRNVTITTDERGDPRPDAAEHACDIGAYESSY